MAADNITAKLIADLRTRLLDLRNGNKLLSYKHSERAKTHIRIVGEFPDFIHECLTNNKPLLFCPLPDPDNILPDEQSDEFLLALEEARRLDKAWANLINEDEGDVISDRAIKLDKQIRDRVRVQLGLPPARIEKGVSTADWARLNGINPSFDLPISSDGSGEKKNQSNEIQTLLFPDAMQGKLAGVLDHARTAQQDMGVNLLHMAIGFLEWFETPTAEKPMLAPLLLYPSELDRNLMQRFGDINRATGDRRLNVLFSRAKHGVTVFTSMLPDQIRTDANSPRGTKLLKDYLQFAASGRLDSGHVPFRECDSDFERFVKERLEGRGYEVVAQVGVAGFWIDLGIRHPAWPYGFLLGIECDGAAYHSSLSARDRDRLRQQILEGLGWTIYRVWSTDWFRDQERELTKMISFIEATLSERLVQQRDAEAKKSAFVQAVASEEDLESDLWENKIEDVGEFEELPKEQRLAESLFADTTIQPAQERLDMVEPVLGIYHEAVFDDLGLQLNEELFLDADYRPILTKLIERCVAVEGPIRDDVLARRIGTTHGFHRAGARIREQVLAIAHNLYKTTKEDVGVFFWPIGTRPDTWSTFRKSSGEPRPIDEISTPELRVLGLLALNDHRSSTEDVLVVMSRIAGLQRLRAASRERLDRAYKEARLNASQTSEIRPHLALLGGT